jgi:hypothetical protein
VNDLRELRQLREENGRRKRLVAYLSMDRQILQAVQCVAVSADMPLIRLLVVTRVATSVQKPDNRKETCRREVPNRSTEITARKMK